MKDTRETSEETAPVVAWETPEYTVVETALEVTGYFHADR
ncbi:pyrroloquinoline quinone precursor peptide PqqA [Streptomyces mauvecolor]|uniref:Coenzyme PQQ synthesis protein A n=1 Tax=Streptomyces mauvecolor TaxID=58345 RepID=A0ABV9UX15_9ACTN